MKKIILSVLFLLITLSFSTKVQAAGDTLNFECFNSPNDHCDLTGTNPLFSEGNDGVWYPGRTATKTISLKNSTSDSSQMNLRGNRAGSSNILEDVLSISLTPAGGGPVLWSGTLDQFYNAGYIGLGSFSSGASLDYYLTASFDPNANNDYQGISSNFNLDLNFSQSAPSSDGGGGGGAGGGTVLGAGVSVPSCNDSKPGSTPTLTSVIATGSNQVTLNWTEAGNPVTYYLVAYGTSPGTLQYGNPNVGGSGTTSYVVSGLSGGTTYYFRVRAGNGCKPGDYSNELSATPGGEVIGGPASGFLEGVLGAKTDELKDKLLPTPSLMPYKEVLGTEESPTSEEQSFIQGIFNGRNLFLFLAALMIFLIGFKFWQKRFSED